MALSASCRLISPSLAGFLPFCHLRIVRRRRKMKMKVERVKVRRMMKALVILGTVLRRTQGREVVVGAVGELVKGRIVERF